MALCRFEAKIISRSGGRSSVGSAAYRTGHCATSAAAYRAAATLKDERTGTVHDFTRKRGVMGAEIMLPAGAPDWMRDREKLWNAVEKAEKRADAQLARDHILSLPHELTAEQRRALTRAFVQEQFVDKGLVADIAWHAPHGNSQPEAGHGGDARNVHAHVMVVMRRIDPTNTETGFARTKERAPEGQHPAEHWKAQLRARREAWANAGADALEKAGFALEGARFRAGHLTLDRQREAAVARGDLVWAERLDREAEPKQGPLATKIEREGRASHAGDDRRAAQARNAERAELKAEHAAVTAEIIDLERRRRMDGEALTDERMKQQSRREAAALAEAKAMKERLAGFEQTKTAEAETARQEEAARRRADERRAATGEINDAKSRYDQALGQHYDVRDPYTSLARAAMAEYATFQRQQETLRKEIAATHDPQERAILHLQQRIEGFDYMAITSERLAGISAVIAGREAAPQATLDRERAEYWREEAAKARDQRAQQIEAQQRARDEQSRPREPARDQPNQREAAFRAAADQTRPAPGSSPGQAPARAETSRPNDTGGIAATSPARRGDREAQDQAAGNTGRTGTERTDTAQPQAGRPTGAGRGGGGRGR